VVNGPQGEDERIFRNIFHNSSQRFTINRFRGITNKSSRTYFRFRYVSNMTCHVCPQICVSYVLRKIFKSWPLNYRSNIYNNSNDVDYPRVSILIIRILLLVYNRLLLYCVMLNIYCKSDYCCIVWHQNIYCIIWFIVIHMWNIAKSLRGACFSAGKMSCRLHTPNGDRITAYYYTGDIFSACKTRLGTLHQRICSLQLKRSARVALRPQKARQIGDVAGERHRKTLIYYAFMWHYI
jgi:hypothetical protein